MRSFFAMVATSPCTKIAMECPISRKVNGCVGSALYHLKSLWCVLLLIMHFLCDLHDVIQSCMLCPNEGGAFKQTVNGEWVHLLCAIWIPETRVANEVLMEPVTGVDRISKPRWKLVRSDSVVSGRWGLIN